VVLPALAVDREMFVMKRPTIPAPGQIVDPGYQRLLEEAPEDLREHWEALERFRIQLDRLEEELDGRDLAVNKPPLSTRSASGRLWWSRLFGFGH
jgi:hypothetical protein